MKSADLPRDEVGVCSEELCGTGVACDAKRPGAEAGIRQSDCTRIPVLIACDLAEDPVVSPRICKDHRGTELRLGKIGEWKRNDDYRTRCRWDQAASSSGRFQSWASAGSLNMDDSWAPGTSGSSRIMTKARQGVGSFTDSRRRTFPCSSITASMALIIQPSTPSIACNWAMVLTSSLSFEYRPPLSPARRSARPACRGRGGAGWRSPRRRGRRAGRRAPGGIERNQRFHAGSPRDTTSLHAPNKNPRHAGPRFRQAGRH